MTGGLRNRLVLVDLRGPLYETRRRLIHLPRQFKIIWFFCALHFSYKNSCAFGAPPGGLPSQPSLSAALACAFRFEAFTHADDNEPQGERYFGNSCWQHDVGKEMSSNRRRNNVRENVGHISEPPSSALNSTSITTNTKECQFRSTPPNRVCRSRHRCRREKPGKRRLFVSGLAVAHCALNNRIRCYAPESPVKCVTQVVRTNILTSAI
jgi:hypothetical protein